MNGKAMLAGATMMAAAMSAQSGYTPSMDKNSDLWKDVQRTHYSTSGRSNRTASTRKLVVAKRNEARRAQKRARRNNRR
jgi:hypothetical protein